MATRSESRIDRQSIGFFPAGVESFSGSCLLLPSPLRFSNPLLALRSYLSFPSPFCLFQLSFLPLSRTVPSLQPLAPCWFPPAVLLVLSPLAPSRHSPFSLPPSSSRPCSSVPLSCSLPLRPPLLPLLFRSSSSCPFSSAFLSCPLFSSVLPPPAPALSPSSPDPSSLRPSLSPTP